MPISTVANFATVQMEGTRQVEREIEYYNFDELISRIRDIRSSEKVFYRKVLEIYATSIDYDPRSNATQKFFATVQNKMHFSVHGQTAAEVIYDRVNAEKDFMGLTSWSGYFPSKSDTEYAKNYLSGDEVDTYYHLRVDRRDTEVGLL